MNIYATHADQLRGPFLSGLSRWAYQCWLESHRRHQKIPRLVVSPTENTNKTNLTRVCLEADPQVSLSGPFFTAFPAFMPAQTNNKGVCFNHAKKRGECHIKVNLAMQLEGRAFKSEIPVFKSVLHIQLEHLEQRETVLSVSCLIVPIFLAFWHN